jgi:hypothetical protein
VTGTAEAVTEKDRNLGNGKDADNTQKKKARNHKAPGYGGSLFP